MCGIAGVLYADPARPVDPAVLQAMGDSIAHRGPDAEGFWIEPGVGLVHRRLSIIDLAGGRPADRQRGRLGPGRLQRRDLQLPGAACRAGGAGPPLPHPQRHRGARPPLRGGGRATWSSGCGACSPSPSGTGRGAGCCWPATASASSRSTSTATREKLAVRLGVQGDPGPSRRVAATVDVAGAGGLPRLRHGPRRADRSSESIEKLPPGPRPGGPGRRPGTRRRAATGSCASSRTIGRTAEEWQEAIRAKVDETVRLHLIADVPVGAFLSGGLDSSVVVASCAGATAGPLQTFSIGFREEAFSELPYARQVAERFGTRHVEEIVTPDAVSLLDELTHYYDEPFADSSAIPTFLVSRLASRQRQGGALGRRRRRGVRRLRPLRPRPEGGGRCGAGCRPGSAARSSARWPGSGRRPTGCPGRCGPRRC